MATISSIYNRNKSGVAQSFSASPLQGKTTNPNLKSLVGSIYIPQTRSKLNSIVGDFSIPAPTPQLVSHPIPQTVSQPTPQTVSQPTPQTVSQPTPQTVSQPTPQIQQSYSNEIPSEYINPETGTFYKMEDFAPKQQYGDIPQYAGDTLTEGNQSAEQLSMRAADLVNARNDIATGASDPYKVASESGIPYSPEEMRAIEKAYAGIYDPAINSALEKLNQKREMDLIKFRTDEDIRQYRATTEQAGMGSTYVPGANAIVDGYADAVLSGKATLANIPAEYRGLVASAVSGQDIKQEKSPYLKSIAQQGRLAVGGLIDIAESNDKIFGKSAATPIPNMFRSDDFRNYQAQLDFLRGNIIPAALTAMREASATGGALGQVSDREGAWLASSLGALDMNQSADMVKKQLRLIDESLARWQDAVEANASGDGSQPQTMVLNGQTLTLQADGTYE